MLLAVAGFAAGQHPKDAPQHEPFHPTRLLVKFRDDGQAAARNAAIAGEGLRVRRQFRSAGLERLAVLDEANEKAARAAGAQGQAARLRRMQERMAALQASGRFEFVEPDYVLKASATPTDTAFTDGTLWGLKNTGQNGGTAGADIGAVGAWELTTGSAEVIVAVVDSGIRTTHQDLAANLWRNPGETGAGKETNGQDDDDDGFIDNVFGINAIPDPSDPAAGNPMDDNGHGTHVAGTIGAAANDAGPHVGVAWTVRLMACKFLDSGGGGYLSDEIECLDFAVAKGARIVNASYGGYYFSRAEYEALANLRDHGVLVVAAAGNESWNNDSTSQTSYPASYDLANLLAVAALDRTDALGSFSNYGATRVHLGAPGDAIFSCWHTSDTAYETHRGTSMAAPHVAGAAALVLARFPSAPLAEVRRRLLDTTVAVPALAGKTATGGRLNVANALTATPPHRLAAEVTPREGSAFSAGKTGVFRAVVTDLQAVTNASVTAVIVGLSELNLRDDGVAPDTIAADGAYAASFSVPTDRNELEVFFQVGAPGYTPMITASSIYPVLHPPPNDDFATRITIPAGMDFVSVTGSNLNASKENGEPTHAGRPDGRSVWWTWTAPFSGPVRISTAGSGFDTLLAVYTGATLATLKEVAANDDASYRDLYSAVRFATTAGTVYQIAVDGYAAQQGGITLGVLPVVSAVPLPEAVDQPALVFAAASSEPWLGETGTTHDGADAARSGPIEAYGRSIMETAIEGPGFLSFWWQASSESGYDFLRFSVDGVEKASLSGDSGWQRQTIWVGVRSTVRWEYTKDRDVSLGRDAGWVDELSLERFAPAIPSRFGDLDRDGRPTVRDLALLTGYLQRPASLPPQIAAFTDANGDQTVDDRDLRALADAILERAALRPVTDLDGDGIPDTLESLLGLDPTKQDSNNDGTDDGLDDFDHDTLTNAEEIRLGSDPLRLDSDGDGWGDGVEMEMATNILNSKSRPPVMVAASPPVSMLLLAPAQGSTTVASPPVSMLLLSTQSGNGQSANTFIAYPPVKLRLNSP
jgi:subtilisin family serine protease